jgi:hypothetical protein
MNYKDDPFWRALEQIEPDFPDTEGGGSYTTTRAAAILRLNPRTFAEWLRQERSLPFLGNCNDIQYPTTLVYGLRGPPRPALSRSTVHFIKKVMDQGKRRAQAPQAPTP